MPSQSRHKCYFDCDSDGPLHRFPKPVYPHLEKFNSWKAVLDKALQEKGDNYIYNQIRFCYRHFEVCYRSASHRLTPNAIPTIALCRPITLAVEDQVPSKQVDESLNLSHPREPLAVIEPSTSTQQQTEGQTALQKVETETALSRPITLAVEDQVPSKQVDESLNLSHPREPLAVIEPSISTQQQSDGQTALQKVETETGLHNIIMDGFKTKIKNILHNTQFCGICLNSEGNLSNIDQEVEIIVNQQTRTKTLRAINNVVFKENESILASSQICSSCTEKLLLSYVFIENAIETSRIIRGYVNDLFCKSNDIFNHLTEINIESSNIVIVLENGFGDCFAKASRNEKAEETKNGTIGTQKTVEPENKHSKFECDKCNTVLPSFIELKLHKIYCKSLKTFSKQNLNAQNKEHSLKKCRFCEEILHESESMKHMNTYHKNSLHKCLRCNEVFNSLIELQSHENACETKVRNCLLCRKLYTEEKLRSHSCNNDCPECLKFPCIHYKYLNFFNEQKLENIIEAKCLNCDFVCEQKLQLITHVNQKHLNYNPYTCDKCARHFYSKSNLRTHILQSHKEFFVCQYCDSKFHNINVYESHVKSCEDIVRRFACEDCPASFDCSDTLLNHITLRHSKDIFPCGLCNKKFLKESERLEHMFKVHKYQKIKRKIKIVNVECAICQEKFDTKRNLIQHMKSHGPNYTCKICDVTFDTLRQFKAHYRKHNGPFVTCHVCGEEMREILLKRHLTTHSESIVTCGTCGKSFRNVQLLKYHQNVHLESIPCPKCKKLINPARLRRHWNGHLIAENPVQRRARRKLPHLKCDQCNYRTYNNLLLECHINRHHVKVKPYVCHICSKAFIGKHLLKNHIERHNVKSITCMVCLKTFANSACLKMHLRLHTGEKPFTCEICGDRFRSSSIMNVHKLKKHSEKSITCPLCSNKFHTVRDLRRHVIKVHWKQKNKPFDPREVEGLDKEHYHLFHDGRRVKVDDEEVDVYMPCLSSN